MAQALDLETCYSGPIGSAGVGVCRVGHRVGAACEGEILPSVEIADNAIDEDCNGGLLMSVSLGADPRESLAPSRYSDGPDDESSQIGHWAINAWYRSLIMPFIVLAFAAWAFAAFMIRRQIRTFGRAGLQETKLQDRLFDLAAVHDCEDILAEELVELEARHPVSKKFFAGSLLRILINQNDELRYAILLPTWQFFLGAIMASVIYGLGVLISHAVTGLWIPLDCWLFVVLLAGDLMVLGQAFELLKDSFQASEYIHALEQLCERYKRMQSTPVRSNVVSMQEWRQARDE